MFNKDITIHGLHAIKMRYLSESTEHLNKNASTFPLFRAVVDIYAIAPIIGVAYNRKAESDDSKDDLAILLSALSNHLSELETSYRLVILTCSENKALSDEEKIDITFRGDKEQEENNMELFNQYMRGGVDWLYENIVDGQVTKEDKLVNLHKVLKKYKDDFNL
jgi:hypothetical protein